MAESFLFYDLETFGQDPRRTRIAQFAAVRTDANLKVIDEPVSFYVKPADDLLPSPIATLITGITPQHALAEGVSEAEAFARINELMSKPQTCTLGYNTLRFDDEFVRYGLFRNFHDPYEREWRSGNSRWDLLDMLRLVHALRPDGINWPKREDGATSFKLEHLALANDVREGDAHEALSDVYATIGMARRFREAQPRMWDYALRLRDKRYVGSLLDVVAMEPVLHISMRYPASRLCAAPVLPLARHPHINNRVIVFDLEGDIEPLLELSVEEITARLYTRAADLPEGQQRIPLKEVHLNKVPALVAWNHLRDADFERLAIDPTVIEAKAEKLRALAPQLAEKARQVFARERTNDGPIDADASLYDGFLAEGDKGLLSKVRTAPPDALAELEQRFRDPRL
ncbi:MAG TPA: exodeoxyribonuclease I, partial [Stenotrophomonas sp.]